MAPFQSGHSYVLLSAPLPPCLMLFFCSTAEETFAALFDLSPGQLYAVRVRALSEAGPGPWATNEFFTQLATAAAAAVPISAGAEAPASAAATSPVPMEVAEDSVDLAGGIDIDVGALRSCRSFV